MALIEVLRWPWAISDAPPRRMCVHGRIPGVCVECCQHGRRLDTVELRPCSECPCPKTGFDHAWRDMLPDVEPNRACICDGCQAVHVVNRKMT